MSDPAHTGSGAPVPSVTTPLNCPACAAPHPITVPAGAWSASISLTCECSAPLYLYADRLGDATARIVRTP